MEVGMIGVGRMGSGMVLRWLRFGHQVLVYDLMKEALHEVERHGASGFHSIDDLATNLTAPRVVWVMVPEGEPTEQVLLELSKTLSEGDIVVDGGNSFYRDSIRRARLFKERNIEFLDVGTSGGIWGLEKGYCLTVGGDSAAVGYIRPIVQALAPSKVQGYAHVGPSGAGHYCKMVHNAIEYGLMQSYAEGLELLAAKPEFDLDLYQVTQTWRYGSLIRSWLLDLTTQVLNQDPGVQKPERGVDDSGEGRWAVQEAVQLGIPTPVISAALHVRFGSRQNHALGSRLLAALRRKFGGHS